MVFYLKINRDTRFYLQHWVDIISHYEDAKIFVVCDNQKLKDTTNQRINWRGVWHEFIESDRTSEVAKYIADNAVTPGWRNAMFAHLTPFLHAKANGFDKCWNIDGDDLQICLLPDRAAEMMRAVERYADDHCIDAFSLDMYRTLTFGNHWCFGVVYVNNTIDWCAIMKSHCADDAYTDRYDLVGSGRNLDWFFTYLTSFQEARIETFYVENMRRIHHGNYVYYVYLNTGLCYWKNGRHYRPVLCDECGLGEDGSLPIYHDIIKIDIGLTDDDSVEFFRALNQNELKRYLEISGKTPAKKTLSIILYVKNAEEWVASCLMFLGYQHSKDFEIIMIDDGSTDATFRIADKLSELFCGKMRIIRNEIPRGFSRSLNIGLRCACGKYVMFLDYTDLLVGDFVRFFCARADHEQAEVLQSTMYFTLPPGKTKFRKNMSVVQTFMVKSKFDKSRSEFDAGAVKIIRRDLLTKNQLFFDETLDDRRQVLEDFQRKLNEHAEKYEFVDHVSHFQQHRSNEADDKTYCLYTFHNTRVFLNADGSLSHQKDLVDTGDKLPVYVRRSNDDFVLFAIKDSKPAYIELVGAKAELSDEPVHNDYVINSNNKITFVQNGKNYLCAWHDDDRCVITPQNGVWEKFILEEIEYDVFSPAALEEFQRKLRERDLIYKFIDHHGHIHRRQMNEVDDSVYRLYTFHNTRVFLNADGSLSHQKDLVNVGDKLPVYVRRSNDDFVLFVVKDSKPVYIKLVGVKAELNDEPVHNDYIINVDNRIAFVQNGKDYLSAWLDNGKCVITPRNMEWEHFILEEVAPDVFSTSDFGVSLSV